MSLQRFFITARGNISIVVSVFTCCDGHIYKNPKCRHTFPAAENILISTDSGIFCLPSLLSWKFEHECKNIFPFLVVGVCINFWRVWQIRALGCVIEGTGTISPALFMRTRYAELRYGVCHHNSDTVRVSNCMSTGHLPISTHTLINRKLN